MTNPRPALILRTEDEKAIPQAVKEKIERLTEKKMSDGISRNIKAEEKHLIHYQRRIDAVVAGVQQLLDSIDLREKGRGKLDAHMKKLKENYGKALENVKINHELKQTRKINDLSQQVNAFNKERQFEKVRDIQDEIERIKANPGSTGPYQDILADYLNSVKKALHNQALIPEPQIKKSLDRAEEYAHLARPILCTVTPFLRKVSGLELDEDRWMIQIEMPQDPFSEEKKQKLLNVVKILRGDNDPGMEKNLPTWFKIMPQSEKNLFFQTFKKANTTADITEIAPSISSKLRSIPGLANFSEHAIVVMDSKGNIITEDKRLRSSIVSPSRDIKKETDVRDDFTLHNIQQVIDTRLTQQVMALEKKQPQRQGEHKTITVPVLMQTLITPHNPLGPDGRLYSDKKKAIANLKKKYEKSIPMDINGKTIHVKVELISTNHPLNKGRYVTPTGKAVKTTQNDETTYVATGETAKEVVKLIGIAKNYASEYEDSKVDQVAVALVKALALKPSVSDREIHISALEELATGMMGGIPYGSCVSGKDRKGLETMYTDAMRLYFAIYEELPPSAEVSNSVKRKNFVAIFTDIYVTRHQHENAGQNSPGADGIKTPKGYLPEDILNAIKDRTKNKDIHKQCNRLASNNDLGKIKRGRFNNLIMKISEKASSVKNILMNLTGSPREAILALKKESVSSETETKAVNAEKEVIKQIRKILPEKYSITEATGVKQLINLIDKGEDKVSLRELGEICRDRLEVKSKNRTKETASIYKAVLDLARNSQSKSGTDALQKLTPLQPSPVPSTPSTTPTAANSLKN